MNLTFVSDTKIGIAGELHFRDGLVYKFHLHHQGFKTQPAVHTVVGRTVTDLLKMYLEYDGQRFQYPIEFQINGQDELKPIIIKGGNDFWTQMLREAALKAEEDDSDT